MTYRALCVSLVLVAATQGVGFAQLTAQITGAIHDASGAIVPAASITVINEGNGFKWETKANQAGIYTVPLLQPGSYQISVQAAGFRAISRSGIQLDVAQTAALDFTLDVGSAAESITVTDTARPISRGRISGCARRLR